MDTEISAREKNRTDRRKVKNGQIGSKMIGGSVKASYLIGQLILERAKESMEANAESDQYKRSRKGKTRGCAISL